MRILVTGGAGYIGSTAVEMLLAQGFEITVLDDCNTGHADALPSSIRLIQDLLDEMRAAKVERLVFSSSAATYGEPEFTPISEEAPTRPTSAYGQQSWLLTR